MLRIALNSGQECFFMTELAGRFVFVAAGVCMQKPRKRLNLRGFQRTGRDSNPRYAFDVHTISNGVSSLCNALMLSFSRNLLQFYSSFAAAVFVWAWEAFLCVGLSRGGCDLCGTCAGLVRGVLSGRSVVRYCHGLGKSACIYC